MRGRLIELFHKTNYQNRPNGLTANLATQFSEFALEQIADALLASGVIVPPCNIGDAVYRVSFVNKKVEMLKVEGFLCNLASWKAHCTHFIPSWLGNKKEHVYISFSSFGKTVFLSCKEAEKRLAEGGKNNG